MQQTVRYAPLPPFMGYRVGDDGSVWSCWRNTGKPACSSHPSGPWKPLKPDVDSRGRRRFTLRTGGRGRYAKFLASRLVLAAFVGPCPDGMEACHDNGDPSDDRLGNLRWDTHSANLLDRRRHGTNVCGEQIHTAKLTAEDVREIRARRAAGEPISEIAARVGVTATNVSFICNGRTWQHV